MNCDKNGMGMPTVECDSHVLEAILYGGSILSMREQVKLPLNLPAPSGKAKYSQETDSEQVP